MTRAHPERPVVMHRWQRHIRDHPKIIDVVIVLGLVTLSLPGVVLAVDGRLVEESARLPGWLLMGLACAALMGHRRQPRISVLFILGCTIAMSALGFVLTPLLLAPLMVALFLVAVRTDQRTGRAYAAVAIILLSSVALSDGLSSDSFELSVLGPVLWLLLSAVLGAEARLRLAYTDAVRARAEHAERTREDEARHRVAEERIRIARDLHDVVAHHLALANAQATTVAHLMDREPGKARTMAGDLSGTISSALRELKATVGLLRQPDDPETPLEPAPSLTQLSDLTAAFRSAGLAVTVTTDGDPRPLSPGVDLTAFRIIQEALTNVAKHASASTARVRLDYADDLLRITVANDTTGNRPASTDPGYGLIGMRERATSLGGRLRAGPQPAGGFEVVTELPLHPDLERTP